MRHPIVHLLAIAGSILVGCVPIQQDGPESAQPLSLTLLHINDHHSHLDSHPLYYAVDALELEASTRAGNAPDEVQLHYGGFAALTALTHERREQHPDAVTLHAGDAITGTPYFTLFEGEADAALMNSLCFDFFVPGNHEFDQGDAGLARFLDFLAEGDCDTEVLAANIVPGPDSPLQKHPFKPYGLKTIKGQKVAFIGIDIADKTRTSSSPDPDTRFLDERDSAQRTIDQLRDQGVDKVVLLTHYQYANDQRLATELSGVDVIVGGDSHTLLGGDNLRELGLSPEGDYPTLARDRDGNPVCIVQAWHHSHLLGELQVQFDRDGHVSECTGHPRLPVIPEMEYAHTADHWRPLSRADQAVVRQHLQQFPEITVIEPDPDARRLLGEFSQAVEKLQSEVIGTATETLCLARIPGDSASTACPPEQTARHGSDIAQQVARSFMEQVPEAEIALQNAGGVRTDLRAGEITLADAYRLLPFGNTLILFDISGEELKTQLEEAVSYALSRGGSSGAYPYASGLRFEVDPSREAGQRVFNVQVNPRLAGDWTAIEPDRQYRLTVNSFIATGGDGYEGLARKYQRREYTNTGLDYAQSFIDHVRALDDAGQPLAKPDPAHYSTHRFH